LPGERLLYTGDIFRRDEDGYLFFEGRRDDIIKCRGEKISPIEIEEALYRQPAVAEAAVIGEPDPYFGQAVIAFVTPRIGATLSSKSVLRELRTRLEDYKIPTRVHIVGALPKTPNGKIDKKALREWREENAQCSLLAETH
jgi:acyl-coenzyme A synthetase/AMP-(fatty) acid ligase